MKRLLLLLVLSLVILGVAAGPALAWYDMHPRTAYITTVMGPGWDEWAGPSDPLNAIHHNGAIPRSWNVVVGVTWADSEMGARLAPALFINSFSLHKIGGGWSRKTTDPMRLAKYWSPSYAWDPVGSPGVYADDWYVPLGKLAKGTYKGWGRMQTLAAYPTWMDDQGNLLTGPVWQDKMDVRLPHTFTVK
jgi:hypothetical protein